MGTANKKISDGIVNATGEGIGSGDQEKPQAVPMVKKSTS